jgi:DNA-binding MarR family transcriptional regulator
MDDDALATKVAALAQAVTDAALPSAPDLGSSDVAALVALASRDGLTVGEIAAATGLSPSAAVRLVDRLERAWLVRRRRRVSRDVVVDLTQRGSARAASLSAARRAATVRFVSGLSLEERTALATLVDRMIATLSAGAGLDAVRHCRFCDRDRCDCDLHEAGPGPQAGPGRR